jgi:hypothetical protein
MYGRVFTWKLLTRCLQHVPLYSGERHSMIFMKRDKMFLAYFIVLATCKLSGVVVRELSGLWFSSERRNHETNRTATGGQEDEI